MENVAETPGQTAYEAYRESSGGKSLVSGVALPQWRALSREIRHAWEAASEAVLKTWKSND
jgi:hypothetical protein